MPHLKTNFFFALNWLPLSSALLALATLGCASTTSTAAPTTDKPVSAAAKKPAPITLAENIEVAPAWAGHPVGFALLTRGDQQFVAFYDAERNMTIGQRTLGDKSFKLTVLPTQVAWDSHNGIEMALDNDGYLHVSGNMHNKPLIYFRSQQPLDASSLVRVAAMTGDKEDKVTYPHFFGGPDGQFLFAYRDGGSGKGNQIYNLYAPKTQTWKHLLTEPLMDGEGERNAYPTVPELGPDGFFHVVWVWRDSPLSETSHDPSYARSRDMVHWESSHGEPVTLPITYKTGEIVAPVPVNGGIINGGVKLGFDKQKRVIVSFIKYDEKGATQIYNARLENGQWNVVQASDWNYRWAFSGGGSMSFDVRLGGVNAEPDGTLTQSYNNVKEGNGAWVLDPDTLKVVGEKPPTGKMPAELNRLESKWPEMQVMRAYEDGGFGADGVRYVLKWETLPSNRDKPREKPWPPPSTLRLFKLQQQ